MDILMVNVEIAKTKQLMALLMASFKETKDRSYYNDYLALAASLLKLERNKPTYSFSLN